MAAGIVVIGTAYDVVAPLDAGAAGVARRTRRLTVAWRVVVVVVVVVGVVAAVCWPVTVDGAVVVGAVVVVVGTVVVVVGTVVVVVDAGSVPVTEVTVWSSVVITFVGDGTPGRVVVVSAKATPAPARHRASAPAETVVLRSRSDELMWPSLRSVGPRDRYNDGTSSG
jgi:hypothetical protein